MTLKTGFNALGTSRWHPPLAAYSMPAAHWCNSQVRDTGLAPPACRTVTSFHLSLQWATSAALVRSVALFLPSPGRVLPAQALWLVM